MVKISRHHESSGEPILRIEGTLRGAWVAEVRAACDASLREKRRIALDLSGVAFVDRAGTELLQSLQADRRVVIRAASGFVSELLKGGAA
jgi:anti-anti-sigma regulatory factor